MKSKQETEALYAALPGLLLPWYRENARVLPWRENADPYRVWVSEIMLQQTRVEAAIGFYERFLRALPDLRALADAPPDVLMKLWEGLGYYSRAKNLQKAAQLIVREMDGVFPDTVERLAALPGVGPYTAGAIASICFGRAAAAVDGNVLRIIARLTGEDTPIDDPRLKQEIAARLETVYPAAGRGDFTQALMELGATVCTPKSPRCAACPTAEVCAARRTGQELALPVMPAKKAKRRERRTVFLLECDGALALVRRPEKGLLAGMWALPDAEGALDESQALETARSWGLAPCAATHAGQKTHIFTHIVWEMTGWRIVCAARAPRFVWADPAALREQYALPTAYRQFLDAADGGAPEQARRPKRAADG